MYDVVEDVHLPEHIKRTGKFEIYGTTYDTFGEVWEHAIKLYKTGVLLQQMNCKFDGLPYYDEFGRDLETIFKQEIL